MGTKFLCYKNCDGANASRNSSN